MWNISSLIGLRRGFWHDFLGFDESYDLKKNASQDLRAAFIKINDHQHVELYNERPPGLPRMMNHLCVTVDDVQQMRTYLLGKKLDVESGGGKTLTGAYGFEINDPDDVRVEFVQSLPTGVEAQEQFQRSADLALYNALLLIVSLSSRLLDHCNLGPIAADPTYGLECRDECLLSCVTNIAFPFWMRQSALINKSNSDGSPPNG